MQAYRDRYAKIQEEQSQVVGISTDDVETLKKFKESVGAPFPFLSDPGGKVASQYGGLTMGYAKRVTYVIAQDGTIVHTESGSAAIVPDQAVDACSRGKKTQTI
jgi:thioredoxin-dependent peroxiredoxin